ncbi:septal ring lytic transglycosylase RlpA family protein [Streptomyces tauricus]|uniref:Septal ring lytic transglycosylase RlpA family protein n=1 Tax=Streptomyces tauricus TaxID=68274 RepID=A0ABZ1JKQ8_9ACTN|nr:hypothetical protein [Streptomyces tauricus]
MSRRRTLGTKKKIALLVSAAAVAGGGAFALATTSNATPAASTAQPKAQSSVVCDGLATALGNNEKFIEGQRTAPDAQSEARIANREAVIAQIKVQQEASGCTVGESDANVGNGAGAGAGAGAGTGAEAEAPAEQPSQAASAPAAGGGDAAVGEQVCNGSTVTLSGEAGAPAASSNQFPAGTKLKVTNLDNNKSTTVEVTSVSGSCVLLNNEAFEQVREPGKFLIRKAVIEKVG